MAKLVYTFDDLFINMDNDLINLLEKIGQEALDLWVELLKKNWYIKNKPSEFYTRTMETLESITKTSVESFGGGYKVRIYFDPDKINYYPARNGDTFDSHEIPHFMMGLLEEGYEIFNTGKIMEGSHAYEQAIEFLWGKSGIVAIVKRELRKKYKIF